MRSFPVNVTHKKNQRTTVFVDLHVIQQNIDIYDIFILILQSVPILCI